MRRARRAIWLAIAVLAIDAGCGVRAPGRIDHGALVRRLGPVEARRTLELRTLEHPRDLGARLALAALDEQTGRPSGAIEQLEAVVAIGGPLGTRWHDDDRTRLARLLAARGRARLARGSPTALAELVRARGLGAGIEDDELARAKAARAVARLRHVDPAERASGRAELAALAGTPGADPAWRGALANAKPAERGAFGAWLWSAGARRAAWDELVAWHAGTAAPRDPAIQHNYLVARAWWSPPEAPPLAASELVGPARCRFREAACDPARVLGDAVPGELEALLAAPARERTTDPTAARAWLEITLGQALRGDASWGPAFAARVDTAVIPIEQLPTGMRAAFAQLAGRDRAEISPVIEILPGASRLVAAGRALRGAPAAEVRAALGPLAESYEGRALLAVVESPAADRSVADRSVADRTAADRTGGNRPAGDRSAADRAAADRAAADRSAVDRSAVDRTAADRSAADRTAADRSAADRTAADRTSADAGAADRTAADRSSADASAAERSLAERTSAGSTATQPRASDPSADSFAAAAVAYIGASVPDGPPAVTLRRLIDAYRRDPAIADRLALDAIAEATDDAIAHAALGTLFDVLGDPARARAAWQAAVASSPEPAFVRALAEVAARAKDPDAALVFATTAAASSGDPAAVWSAMSRALEGAGSHAHALEAARYAIDLAGPDELAGALDAAIDASRSFGRTAQVEALATRRAAAAPPPERRDEHADDPTDAATALARHRAQPSEATVAALWLASRWNPRDVASRAALRAALSATDPRRLIIEAELVVLAADRDRERARAAVTALR
ncbi:MAG: hypothetical protein ACTHU0_06250 [Kofleriaceae bacterium]